MTTRSNKPRLPRKTLNSTIAYSRYQAQENVRRLFRKHVYWACHYDMTKDQFVQAVMPASNYAALLAAKEHAYENVSCKLELVFRFEEPPLVHATVSDTKIISPRTVEYGASIAAPIVQPIVEAMQLRERYRDVFQMVNYFYDNDVTLSAIQYHWPAGFEFIARPAYADVAARYCELAEFPLETARRSVTLLAASKLIDGDSEKNNALTVKLSLDVDDDYTYVAIPFAEE